MHNEKHLKNSGIITDIIIGMSDGLTVPFALAAGISSAVSELALEYEEVERVPDMEKAKIKDISSPFYLISLLPPLWRDSKSRQALRSSAFSSLVISRKSSF